MKRITSFKPEIFERKHGCIICVVWFLLVGTFGVIGESCKDFISPELWLLGNLVFFGVIIHFLQKFKKRHSQELAELASYTEEYNNRVKDFNAETGKLKSQYSQKEGTSVYYKMRALFDEDTEHDAENWNANHPKVVKTFRTWKWLGILTVIYCMAGCGFQFGLSLEDTQPSSLMSEQGNHLWSAENIPMPHLTDGNQYVSNPDGVLAASQSSWSTISKTMTRSASPKMYSRTMVWGVTTEAWLSCWPTVTIPPTCRQD